MFNRTLKLGLKVRIRVRIRDKVWLRLVFVLSKLLMEYIVCLSKIERASTEIKLN